MGGQTFVTVLFCRSDGLRKVIYECSILLMCTSPQIVFISCVASSKNELLGTFYKFAGLLTFVCEMNCQFCSSICHLTLCSAWQDFRPPCRHFSIFLSNTFYQSFLLWVLDFTFLLENFTTPSLEGNFPMCVCYPTLYLTFKSLVLCVTLQPLTLAKCVLACVPVSFK